MSILDASLDDLWTTDSGWAEKARAAIISAEQRGAPDHLVRGWRRRLTFSNPDGGPADGEALEILWREAEGWGRPAGAGPQPVGAHVDDAAEGVKNAVGGAVDSVKAATPWWVYLAAGLAVMVAVAYVVRTVR